MTRFALVLAAVISIRLAAQVPAPDALTFEVTSIRQNNSGDSAPSINTPTPGRVMKLESGTDAVDAVVVVKIERPTPD